jgi:hypothetical protein
VTVNMFAGMGSHQSAKSETDTWFSPPAIIEALGGADSFDLDPCSHVERPWPTARQHYVQEDNGLLLPWFGRVWLNPPYSITLITRFLGRLAEHDRGTALIFARTETDPFHRFVWGAASGLLFLRGRLNFHRADGSRAEANGGAPSVLIAYGEEDCEILAAAPINGAFVPLRLRAFAHGFAAGGTWAEALDAYMRGRTGPIALGELYRAFADHPKTRANQHWRDKLRQVLQRGAFERVDKGLWQRIAA